MKQWFRIFLNLPFRSFQFRLLIYLLLVGSIPLVCAMFVFYQQSSDYAKNELISNANQLHGQITQQILNELLDLEHISKNINSDYLVQRYIESGGTSEIGQEEFFIAHLDQIVFQQKSNSRYVTDVCISFDETSKSVCTNIRVAANYKNPPLNKADKVYEMFTDENMPYAVLYRGPLYDVNTSIVRGQVAVLINLGQLLSELNDHNQIYRQVIYSGQDQLIYASDDLSNDAYFLDGAIKLTPYIHPKTNNIVSQSIIEIDGVAWTSVIEVKNEFLTSTWRSLRNTLVVFFAVVLLLSIISSFVFSMFITKPLINLRALFKRAELGDLQAYWTSSSSEEINDLGEGYNEMLNRVGELIKQVKYEESLKKDAEIKALQYQLNPHFLYNTLNTIKWVAKIHKTPQISEVVSALVRLLQASLGKKGEFISIREEISLIKDYMEIQNFRYGEFVKVNVDIDPVAYVCLVPRMILQPLVENAIIHGIEPTNKEGNITIKAWIDRDLLMCQVVDNGKGIPESELINEEHLINKSAKEKMSGIGLKHIREKIKLYYGPDYKMHIFSKPNQGTTVRLSLPIHRNEE